MNNTVYSYDDGKYYDNGIEINWEEVKSSNNQDLLSFILERGNDDLVSYFAAFNISCPSETLAKVLERGNNDEVSWYAALNPNCPLEALVKVLERGNNDEVSISAARSRNCPSQAKMKWYYTLNKNIDSEEKRIDDEDVLRKLISV